MRGSVLLPALEHGQHPVRYQEAADNVDRRQRHGDGAEHQGESRARDEADDDRADEGDSGDGVGAGHQGRVQGGGDLGDHLETYEHSQGEYSQRGYQLVQRGY